MTDPPVLELQTGEDAVIRALFIVKGSPSDQGGVTDVDWVDFYFAAEGYLEN